VPDDGEVSSLMARVTKKTMRSLLSMSSGSPKVRVTTGHTRLSYAVANSW
jgi:hypothetical protein